MFDRFLLFKLNEASPNRPLAVPRTAEELDSTAKSIIYDYLSGYSSNPISPTTKSAKETIENYNKGLDAYVKRAIAQSGAKKLKFVKGANFKATRMKPMHLSTSNSFIELDANGYEVFLQVTYKVGKGNVFYIFFKKHAMLFDFEFAGKEDFNVPTDTNIKELPKVLKSYVQYLNSVLKIDV